MKNVSGKTKLLLIPMLMATFIFSSCKKDKPNLDFQTEYFGLEEGRFVEYDVTYMFHDSLLGKHDTIHYQLRTLVEDTVIDNVGRVARKFYRYQRKDASKPWLVKDLWTAIIEGDRAELVEENQRLIKLVFIPTEDKEWNINAFNNLGDMSAHYSGLNKAQTINGMDFASTVTVEQEDYKTLIDTRRKYEVYAKGVGMVYKYYKNLNFKFGSTKPIKGEEYYYSVINYGVQ